MAFTAQNYYERPIEIIILFKLLQVIQADQQVILSVRRGGSKDRQTFAMG